MIKDLTKQNKKTLMDGLDAIFKKYPVTELESYVLRICYDMVSDCKTLKEEED